VPTRDATYLATVGRGVGLEVGAAILVPRRSVRIDQFLSFDVRLKWIGGCESLMFPKRKGKLSESVSCLCRGICRVFGKFERSGKRRAYVVSSERARLVADVTRDQTRLSIPVSRHPKNSSHCGGLESLRGSRWLGYTVDDPNWKYEYRRISKERGKQRLR
jgi:hypothetical protein